MKKIRVLLILLVPLLLLTGCDSNPNSALTKAVNKTSITKKGLKSYRCKVSINSKDNNISYVVLNDGNRNYNMSVSTNEYSYNYNTGKDNKIGEIIPNEYGSKYKFEDTDRYLNVLENVTDVIVKDEKIDNNSYKKYEFKVSKNELNKILSSFDIKVNKNGKGFAYIDKDNHVYIINYVLDGVDIGVSYTRYNDVK